MKMIKTKTICVGEAQFTYIALYYVFFKKIQNVDSFEKALHVVRAFIKNMYVFMTASDSKLFL